MTTYNILRGQPTKSRMLVEIDRRIEAVTTHAALHAAAAAHFHRFADGDTIAVVSLPDADVAAFSTIHRHDGYSLEPVVDLDG